MNLRDIFNRIWHGDQPQDRFFYTPQSDLYYKPDILRQMEKEDFEDHKDFDQKVEDNISKNLQVIADFAKNLQGFAEAIRNMERNILAEIRSQKAGNPKQKKD